METELITRAKILGVFLSLGIMITAFIEYSFRDGLCIVFILNSLLAISSIIGCFFPIAGQIGYILIVKRLIIPAFFSQWFPEISQTWYVDLVFWTYLLSSASNSILFILYAKGIHDQKENLLYHE